MAKILTPQELQAINNNQVYTIKQLLQSLAIQKGLKEAYMTSTEVWQQECKRLEAGNAALMAREGMRN